MMRRCLAVLCFAVGCLQGQIPVLNESSVLSPPSPVPADEALGVRVAVSSQRVVVGNDNAAEAYLFDVHTGELIVQLQPSGPGIAGQFGSAVAVSEQFVVVGARNDTIDGLGSGSVLVYDAMTGDFLRKITRDDGAPQTFFGTANQVAIAGSMIAVGVPGDDRDGLRRGAVYLFDASTGAQLRKIVPADAVEDYKFGQAVALSGTTLLAGAAVEGTIINGATGAAYLFDTDSGEQIARLDPINGATGEFGSRVDIDQGLAVVGAPLDNAFARDAGAVYVFNSTSGELIRKILPSGPPSQGVNAQFGSTVGLVDETVGVRLGGQVFFLDPFSGVLLYELVPIEKINRSRYGGSIALAQHAVVSEASRAFVFEIPSACNAADVALPFDTLNFFDVSAFIGLFLALDAAADLADPQGAFTFADIAAFLDLYNSGCP